MIDQLDNQLSQIKKALEGRTANTNKLADEGRGLLSNTVTQSNGLARAYYRFNLADKRLMAAVASKLNPLRGDNNEVVVISVVDYAKLYRVDPTNVYREVKAAAKRLIRNPIINMVDGDEKENPFLIEALYKPKSGQVECIVNPMLKRELELLQKHFSSYDLAIAAEFKSVYTWRMFELLCSWAKPRSQTNGVLAGWFQIEKVELRKILGVAAGYNQGQFQKSVIDSSIKELKLKADLLVRFKPVLSGKTITHYKVDFIQNEQITLI